MAINWIGFRPSPKAPPGTQPFSFEQTLQVAVPLTNVLPFFTSKAGLSTWFDRVTSIDARQGGAVEFVDSDGETYGGAFAQLNIPKSLLMVTERLGGIEVKFREQGDSTELRLTVSRLLTLDEEPRWRIRVAKVMHSLEAAIGEMQA